MTVLAIVTVAIFAVSTAVSFAAATYTQLTRDLPSAAQLATRDVFQTTKVYDRNGELLDELYDQTGGRRTLVPLSDVSPWLVDATLAAEDVNFYDDPGVDPYSIARAVWLNFTSKGVVSGASTAA